MFENPFFHLIGINELLKIVFLNSNRMPLINDADKKIII